MPRLVLAPALAALALPAWAQTPAPAQNPDIMSTVPNLHASNNIGQGSATYAFLTARFERAPALISTRKGADLPDPVRVLIDRLRRAAAIYEDVNEAVLGEARFGQA